MTAQSALSGQQFRDAQGQWAVQSSFSQSSAVHNGPSASTHAFSPVTGDAHQAAAPGTHQFTDTGSAGAQLRRKSQGHHPRCG